MPRAKPPAFCVLAVGKGQNGHSFVARMHDPAFGNPGVGVVESLVHEIALGTARADDLNMSAMHQGYPLRPTVPPNGRRPCGCADAHLPRKAPIVAGDPRERLLVKHDPHFSK